MDSKGEKEEGTIREVEGRERREGRGEEGTGVEGVMAGSWGRREPLLDRLKRLETVLAREGSEGRVLLHQQKESGGAWTVGWGWEGLLWCSWRS